MRILIISRNAWDDTNAIGNTLSNFFSGIDNIEFANIYFRSTSPNNKYCQNYYQTSEVEVMRKWFTPEKIGKQFVWDCSKKKVQCKKTVKKDKKLIRFIHKYNIKLAYKLADYLWYSEKWINDNLKSFIESFAPDVMFAFVKSAPQYYLTIKYLRENFNIPLFSWIADDEYTGLLNAKHNREIQNLAYILNESSLVKGCSEEICRYYNLIFNCDATPLYKGCDLSTPIKNKVNDPIKIVYAGNLLYGRLDIIHRISDIIEGYSANGKQVSFEVYSNTVLMPSEERACFGKKKCTAYMGKREYGYIKERLAQADVVLHVESFDDEQIVKTKYSFSTKIIDYLQSGSVLLGVGPAGIASINYIKKIPGTYLIDNLELLDSQLRMFLTDTNTFLERAESSRAFAYTYHDSIKKINEVKCILEKCKNDR